MNRVSMAEPPAGYLERGGSAEAEFMTTGNGGRYGGERQGSTHRAGAAGARAETRQVQRRASSRRGQVSRVQGHPEAEPFHLQAGPVRLRQGPAKAGQGKWRRFRDQGLRPGTSPNSRSALPRYRRLPALQQRVHLAAEGSLQGGLPDRRSR